MCAAVLPWPERWSLCRKEGWPGVGAGPERGPHGDDGAPARRVWCLFSVNHLQLPGRRAGPDRAVRESQLCTHARGHTLVLRQCGVGS